MARPSKPARSRKVRRAARQRIVGRASRARCERVGEQSGGALVTLFGLFQQQFGDDQAHLRGDIGIDFVDTRRFFGEMKVNQLQRVG